MGQEQLAALSDVPVAEIEALERGAKELSRPADRLAKALGLSEPQLSVVVERATLYAAKACAPREKQLSSMSEMVEMLCGVLVEKGIDGLSAVLEPHVVEAYAQVLSDDARRS
jgi:DNA-binding Lrp family transcriptional regulator